MNGAKPPRGGEYLTLYLITHLRRDIFHPVLIYAEDGTIVKEIKKAGIDSVHFPLNRNITGIYPREIKLYNPFFILKFVWFMLAGRNLYRLKRILSQHNVHLIYCADNLSKFIGGIVGKMSGVKVVAHCHDDFKEDILGKTMRMFYLMLLDRILTVSDKVKNFFTIKENGFQKAITVYNGIDADIFNPQNVPDDIRNELGLKKENIVIGSIGVIEKDKGHRYLVEALARLKAEGLTNIVCVICGTGPLESDLKEFVYAEGLDSEVLFLGFRNDIPRVLKIFDIMVMTSLTIEACPMVVLEAMAMKVPIIATKVGGLPELINDGKTGILFPPRDVDALCKAIEYLVKNPGVRMEMGKKGREKVLRQFTIKENVRKTEEVFLEVIKGK